MKEINLPNYNIYINDHFASYNDYLNSISNNAKIFVITDENVFSHYKIKLEEKINNTKLNWYVLKPGDDSKNTENVLKIIDFLFKNDAKRSDIIISFGGGMVTDITGLVSSIYLRGINLVHIPTTIIGQIDSAIGGKTAVNYQNHKNIIGTFYDPKLIICETDYFKTLERREIINGLGELIKTGLIGDATILDLIDITMYWLTPAIIEKAINVKKNYVLEDYFDKSTRNTLNFGHTIGHAVEASSDFLIPHGEAVIIGMKKALEVGISLELTNSEVLNKFNNIIKKIGYKIPKIDYDYYEKFLYKDKKSKSNSVRFVFLKDIEKPLIKEISWEELKHELVNK